MDILPIEDVVPHRTNPRSYPKYSTTPNPADRLEVWDAQGWATVTCMTATWNGFERKPNKTVHRIAARGAVYHATGDHKVFVEQDGKPVEMPAEQVQKGDKLALISLPQPTNMITMTEDEAWLLGVMAAEGYAHEEGKIQFTNQDQTLLDEVEACWRRVTGGTARRSTHPSGFANGKEVTQLHLNGGGVYGRYLFEALYTRSGHKRIPIRVLNATCEARRAFLHGFHAGDGLKSTPCTYTFQGFKTASASMAAGLYWLATTTLGQRAIVSWKSAKTGCTIKSI